MAKGDLEKLAQSVEEVDADRAFEVETKVKNGMSAIRKVWVALAGFLHEFHEGGYWVALGHPDFNTWLATPEIDMGRSYAYSLIEVYRDLVASGRVTEERLCKLDSTKVATILPSIRAGGDLREALADCESLSRTDLREKYRTSIEAESGDSAAKKASKGKTLAKCDTCGLQVVVAEGGEPVEVNEGQMTVGD